MFTPDLDLKVVTRCRFFSFLDKTGVDAGGGDKWSGVSGLSPATLTEATITIINPSGVGIEYDILSQIPVPVTGSFWFNDITGTNVDGLHNVIYKLKTTDFAITAYADHGTTVSGAVKVTAAGHGLITGMYVDITGSTNYNGEYYITKIDSSNFYIRSTWITDDGASTGTTEYLASFYPYVYCASEAAVDKMFANISRMVPGETRKRYLDDALTAWGLLQSLKSAVSSSNTTSMNLIQSELDQIFEFNHVDANL